MEVPIGNRRLKMIDGKVCIVPFNLYGVEVQSGKFRPIKFSDNKGYNACNILIDGNKRKMFEHRLVWKLAYPEWDIFDSSINNVIDHENRSRRDNRLENLRNITQSQNMLNTQGKGFRLTPNGRYCAEIRVNRVNKYLGTFDTAEEARASYLAAKKKYHLIVYNELQ